MSTKELEPIPPNPIQLPPELLYADAFEPAAVSGRTIWEEERIASTHNKEFWTKRAHEARIALHPEWVAEYPLEPSKEHPADSIIDTALDQRKHASVELAQAVKRDDTKRIIDVEPSDLFTMARAVSLFGSVVSQKFNINPDKITISQRQLDAVARKKTTVENERQTELLNMSKEDVDNLLDSEVGTAPVRTETGVSDETREMNVTATAWEEFHADAAMTVASSIDDASYIVTGLSLGYMEKYAVDESEKQAATFALMALRTVIEQQTESVQIIQPEILERAETTGTLGPWAGATVVHAIAEQQLLAA